MTAKGGRFSRAGFLEFYAENPFLFVIFNGKLLVLYVHSSHDSDTLGLIGAISSRCLAILGSANDLALPSISDGSSRGPNKDMVIEGSSS